MKKNTFLFFLFLGFILFFRAMEAEASLKLPTDLPSAQVLPKGVRNLSYRNLQVSAEQKLGESGESVSIADPFFKNITFEDIVEGKKLVYEASSVRHVVETLGYSGAHKVAETIGEVDVKASAHVPVMAYGVTDSLTLALAIPVIHSHYSVSTGVRFTDPKAIEDFFAEASNRDPAKAQEFKEKITDPINSKLKDYGYSPLASSKQTKLGDIRVISKFSLLKNSQHHLSLKNEVVLPTGKTADPDNLLDIPAGDGQIDAGLGINYDYSPFSFLTVSSEIGYLHQFRDSKTLRIPEKADSKVSPDKEKVERKLGDMMLASTAIKGSYSHFSLGLGYSYQYKQQDGYRGDSFASTPNRYQWMSQETQQEMHSALFSLGVETIGAYKRQEFPIPLKAEISHGIVLKGKNVVKDPVWALNFSLFF